MGYETHYTKPFSLSIKPTVLSGTRLQLEPLTAEHLDDLSRLCEPEIWQWYTVPISTPEALKRFLSNILNEQESNRTLAFAIRDRASGLLIGSSRYMNLDPTNRRIEIGSTWFSAKWQRTYGNTESKLLMLSHAFENLCCISVCFQTDALNEKSRRAIERLGARLDGILRFHRICQDGRIRDSAVYSITELEWPKIKTELIERLTRGSETHSRS